jgi:hypothetical protein
MGTKWETGGEVTAIMHVSGFRRNVDEICALLEYYAALSSSSVLTVRDSLSVPFLDV